MINILRGDGEIMREVTYEDLMDNVKSYINDDESLELISRAFFCANKFHAGQKRQSGEDYIVHPLSVAFILSEMKADADTICAGLLHDTIEDTSMSKEKIAADFNETIAKLVDGVTKISKMNFSSREEQVATNTRKIITSLQEDVRIVIIKLADRLHNMRTLEYKSEFKQKENALETMEIFVPLAYNLGAYKIKSELEDLALYYLKNDAYVSIEDKISEMNPEATEITKEMASDMTAILNKHGIPFDYMTRIKSIYGIYKKLSKGKKMSDIHDLLAIKIMTDSVDDCYRTLGLVHNEFAPLNSKFRDYIGLPKTNMYRSLHTTVFGYEGHLVQFQIRTYDMEKIDNYGLTAYWDIKKHNAEYEMQEDLKNKLPFFQTIKDIDYLTNDNAEFVKNVKRELFNKTIYVYTYKGDVVELPAGSTPIDFAYKLGADIGNTIVSATVNDAYVPADTILQNRDRVKIITNDKSLPNDEWRDKVKTVKAKKLIKKYSR